MIEMGESPTSDPPHVPGLLNLAQSVDGQVGMAIGQTADCEKPPQVDLRGGFGRRGELLSVYLEAERDPIGVGECQNRALHGLRR